MNKARRKLIKRKQAKKVKEPRRNKFFSYKGEERTDRNFLYKDFNKSDSIHSRFTRSNFSFVNFNKASMKYCGFNGATFVGSEFKHAKLTGSRFNGAVFKDTLFYHTKLERASFHGATFDNVIFFGTSIRNVRGLSPDTPGIRIIITPPKLELSKDLKEAIDLALCNVHIKESETLRFRKQQRDNTINLMLLQERFAEADLIHGLKIARNKINKGFHTLSYLIGFIKRELARELVHT